MNFWRPVLTPVLLIWLILRAIDLIIGARAGAGFNASVSGKPNQSDDGDRCRSGERAKPEAAPRPAAGGTPKQLNLAGAAHAP
jgi:hypothetical protein